MRVEDRGNSREEQKRVTETLKNLQQTDDTMRCNKCGGSGVCSDDSYSEFTCPFCEAGKRTQVEHNPISAETTATPIDLHTCWYDDDGNVRCSEGW
jgi:hypothetical protein